MELCERLPWWESSLGPAVALLVSLSLALPVLGLVVSRARRRLTAPELHWSDQARIAAEHKVVILFIGSAAVGLNVLFVTRWVSASGCSRTVSWALAGAGILTISLFQRWADVDASYRRARHALGARLRSLGTILIVLQPGYSCSW